MRNIVLTSFTFTIESTGHIASSEDTNPSIVATSTLTSDIFANQMPKSGNRVLRIENTHSIFLIPHFSYSLNFVLNDLKFSFASFSALRRYSTRVKHELKSGELSLNTRFFVSFRTPAAYAIS